MRFITFFFFRESRGIQEVRLVEDVSAEIRNSAKKKLGACFESIINPVIIILWETTEEPKINRKVLQVWLSAQWLFHLPVDQII